MRYAVAPISMPRLRSSSVLHRTTGIGGWLGRLLMAASSDQPSSLGVEGSSTTAEMRWARNTSRAWCASLQVKILKSRLNSRWYSSNVGRSRSTIKMACVVVMHDKILSRGGTLAWTPKSDTILLFSYNKKTTAVLDDSGENLEKRLPPLSRAHIIENELVGRDPRLGGCSRKARGERPTCLRKARLK